MNRLLPSSEDPSVADAIPVLLLGLDSAENWPGLSAADSLDELALLVETWGGRVVGRVVQERSRPDPGWYVGRGKLEETIRAAGQATAEVVAADTELTPAQLRNVERAFKESGHGLRVVDRTQIILEIFADRARSREGKLEVELAQAVYALPRLIGKGSVLSRLGGSAGGGLRSRGLGETRLELDRRRLRLLIGDLRREIGEVARQREVQAKARREGAIPLISLVGYTNAGKSSLFNQLTGAGVAVEDRLFATLDPVIRKISLPNNQKALLSDTVGFIRKLPHHLVAAFRATLDEVRWADVLVHVIDASDQSWPQLARAAEAVLTDVASGGEEWRRGGGPHYPAPIVYALNKVDLLPGGAAEALSHPRARELARSSRVVALSAAIGEGLDGLLAALVGELAGRRRVFVFTVPYDRARLVSSIHDKGRVLREDYTARGVEIEVEIETVAGLRLAAALGKEGGEAALDDPAP